MSRPDISKILVKEKTNKTLIDQRLHRRFLVFGNIMDVARQYGIKSHITKDGIVFEAPKSRLQTFAEKLHFSEVQYIDL